MSKTTSTKEKAMFRCVCPKCKTLFKCTEDDLVKTKNYFEKYVICPECRQIITNTSYVECIMQIDDDNSTNL